MRLRFVIKKKYHAKYLFLIIASMAVPALIVGSFLYYFIFTVVAEQLGIPEIIAINLLPALRKVNITIVLSIIPLFVLLIFWALLLLHRFVGPIERIEGDLDKILKGESVQLRVREHDEIKGIIEKVNKIIKKLKS